jgi:DNA-binding transcriptional MerR regulator
MCPIEEVVPSARAAILLEPGDSGLGPAESEDQMTFAFQPDAVSARPAKARIPSEPPTPVELADPVRDPAEDLGPALELESLGEPPGGDPRVETADDPRIPAGKAYFKIGEVARITGVKPYVLRYWETEFPWLRPSKTSTRQRLYRRQDIALLFKIKRLRYEEHETIANAKQQIKRARGQDPRPSGPSRPAQVAPAKPKEPAERALPLASVGARLALAGKNPGSRAKIGRALRDMRGAVMDLLHAAERISAQRVQKK